MKSRSSTPQQGLFSLPGGTLPPEPRSNNNVQAPPVHPDTAKRIIESRPMPKIWEPPAGFHPNIEGSASNTVEGAPSIVELTRALQNDPQLIFEFVYNNIEFVPTFGIQKGALGCLIDNNGNSFDQCALLVALLRQAGFTANYELGQVALNATQLTNWLGITDNNVYTALYVLSNGGIPATVIGTYPNQQVQFSHCWVKVNVGTVGSPNWVVMDPSYKTYSYTTGTNLATAMSYSQSTFLSNARSGYTIDSSGNWVENLNRANIRSQLDTLAGNLISWIKTNNPTATVDNILGGRTIVPIYKPFTYLTSLPYEIAGDVPTEWTGDVPTTYKVTVELQFPGLDVTFTSDQIYGGRLTWIYNSSYEPVLTLNGTVVATGTAQGANTYNSIYFIVTHNAYAVTYYNQSFYQIVFAPDWNGGTGQNYYLIGTSFGPTGKGMVDYHQALYAQNNASNPGALNDAVLGEALSVAWHTYSAQVSMVNDLVGRMNNTTSYIHHQIGMCFYLDYTSPAVTQAGCDIEGVATSGANLDGSNTEYTAGGIERGMHGYTLEMLAFQQVFGVDAASTTRVLDLANSAGTQIYKGTSSNWSGTVEPALSGYNATDLSNIYNYYLQYGWDVLIPQAVGQTFDHLTLSGWSLWSGGAIGIIESSYAGVVTGEPTGLPPNHTPFNIPGIPPALEPVNSQTGAFEYTHADLSIGSGQFPYKLDFTRKYDSRLQYQNGPLGLGWTHNWGISALVGSSGFKGLGSESPIDAAASIAELYVTLDMLSDTTYPVDKMVICAINCQWWTDQLTNNIVTVSYQSGDYNFTLLPDGTYNPPPNCADKLAYSSGTYTYTTPEQSKLNFNSSGQLTSWVFPYGVTITLNYTSGVLTSVTNGLGRTLTLNYTSGLLTSVSDGTGRSASYLLDSNQDLTQFTDALSQLTTYNYVVPGRMSQFFSPANPTTAVMTNTYDSLGRVQSQQDALLHQSNVYLSGPRSQIVDPAGNSRIRYFNNWGRVIRDIDALGNETDCTYDGLQRLSTKTLPEGNSFQYVYDSMNNVLNITAVPKSGSGLSNIVTYFTYNSTYNKIATAKNGNGNTTTYNYDPATGNLLSIQRPAISGQTPTVTFTYNSRGQLLTRTDETGIQTQFTYDGTTEKLLSRLGNTNWTATIGGTITVNDVLTLTAHDAGLSGGQEPVSYTVQAGSTLTSVAASLAAAVNADTHLAAIGIIAYSSGPVVLLSTSAGNTTTFTKSTSGGATETITLAAGLNLQVQLGYNSVGDMNSLTDARSNQWTASFDNLRRRTQVVDPSPLSYVTNFGYDGNNNVNSLQRQTTGVPAWQTSTATYSVTNRLTSITDPLGHVLTFNYDSADRLYQRIDAEGRTYQFSYDALNRVYQVTDPLTNICETRTYTNNGRPYQLTDVRSKTTTWSYDGFDRINKVTYPDTTFEQNSSYDSDSNVLTILTRAGNTITNTYDVLDRLSTKAPTSQPTVTNQYDLAGRLISASKPVVSGDPSSGTFQFVYDTAGRFYQEIYPDSKTVTHQLDANGNVTQTTWPDSYYITRIFDQDNRQTDIKLNGASTAAAHYSYDTLSRRTSVTLGNGVTTNYSYSLDNDMIALVENFVGSNVSFLHGFNKVHQLTSVSASDPTFVWHPGSSGTVSYGTANSVNEYPTVGSASYSYNGDGCLTSDGTWTYGFDTEGHLTSASMTGTSASYVYDPVHRQAQKTVGSAETRYIYSKWRRIAEYNGSTGALQIRYVYGPWGDEPVVSVDSSGNVNYYHQDRQGNVIALSNSSGTVTNKYSYAPYGESSSLTGTTHGFSGQRYDSETGLYYFKRRYYSPTLGRFLQPDPIRYSGGLNLYGFVSNDPLNNRDPLGLFRIGISSAPPAPSVPNSQRNIQQQGGAINPDTGATAEQGGTFSTGLSINQNSDSAGNFVGCSGMGNGSGEGAAAGGTTSTGGSPSGPGNGSQGPRMSSSGDDNGGGDNGGGDNGGGDNGGDKGGDKGPGNEIPPGLPGGPDGPPIPYGLPDSPYFGPPSPVDERGLFGTDPIPLDPPPTVPEVDWRPNESMPEDYYSF